jgi:uncharacterized protein YneF (UPF0154 family)
MIKISLIALIAFASIIWKVFFSKKVFGKEVKKSLTCIAIFGIISQILFIIICWPQISLSHVTIALLKLVVHLLLGMVFGIFLTLNIFGRQKELDQ